MSIGKFYPPARLVFIKLPAGKYTVQKTLKEKHDDLLDRAQFVPRFHTMQEVG